MTESGPSTVPAARAGFASRLAAALIDVVPFGVAGIALLAVVGATLAYTLTTVGLFAYLTYFEGGPSGQTIGKRLLGIRVVDVGGQGPIGTSRALVRAIGRYVSFAIFLLGYLWMLWDRDKQTWHDKLAESVVVPVSAPG